MARKHDQHSKPTPKLSPDAASRRVVTAAHNSASVGHNKFSGRRGRRALGIGDPRNGANLNTAPGSRGMPLTAAISPGGPLGST